MRYVIIGNSAAGVKAAETIRQLDGIGGISIIADETTPAYSRCLLPNFLAGTRTAEELAIRPGNFYSANNVQTILGYKALRVDTAKKLVLLEGGRDVSYDKLLVTTGSRSAIPPVPGLEGPDVFGLRTLEDARNILEKSRDVRRVVIMGAGFVGLEAAYALYKRGLEVTVVEKMTQILPQQFDRAAAAILEKDMQAEGIRIIVGQGVTQVASPPVWEKLFVRNGRGVILENGDRLKAELIVVATGTRPNVEVVQDAGVEINRGILVNKFMETSVPDVYAAGDVVETPDAISGQVGLTPIWPNAVAQGKIAAHNMVGDRRPYAGMIGMQNAVEFREVPAIALGITRPVGNEFDVRTVYQPKQNLYRKLVLYDGIIVGVILVGDIKQAGIIGAMMRNKIDARNYVNDILEGRLHYGHFWRRTA